MHQHTFLIIVGYNDPILLTKVRIKPKNLLKSLFSFDFYAFTSRSLSRKIVFCSQKLRLLVDAYFKTRIIFATHVRKSLTDILC